MILIIVTIIIATFITITTIVIISGELIQSSAAKKCSHMQPSILKSDKAGFEEETDKWGLWLHIWLQDLGFDNTHRQWTCFYSIPHHRSMCRQW